jgi:hypothetical protein
MGEMTFAQTTLVKAVGSALTEASPGSEEMRSGFSLAQTLLR